MATPDRLETSIGTLNLTDGYPHADTVEKIYDNLDRSRALQAFLLALPIVEQAGMRDALRKFGPDNQTNFILEDLADSRTIQLTENADTIYNWIWLDSHKGPLVVEMPPKVLGIIDDFWYHWVADVGITGEDKGQGGKYLVLPPGYEGDVPKGYFVIRPNTYGTWLIFRGYLVDGSTKPAVDSIKQHLKIYNLADAANPPAMKFVNGSGLPANFVLPDRLQLLDAPERRHSGRTRRRPRPRHARHVCVDRHRQGQAVRSRCADEEDPGGCRQHRRRHRANDHLQDARDPNAYYYPNSSWRVPFLGGYKFEMLPGVAHFDGAINFFYLAGGVTPAMDEKMVGKGSQYPWAVNDSKGHPFNGGKTYELHLPPNVPAKDFWSAVVYDNQTRSLLQTDQQFPSVSSHSTGLKTNADGSVDVYFGPTAPAGFENNWVQTIPGKGWFVLFRLYGPLEPWFDKTWRPGEIELIR